MILNKNFISTKFMFPEHNVSFIINEDNSVAIKGDIIDLALALYDNSTEYCSNHKDAYSCNLFYFDCIISLNLKNHTISWEGNGPAPFLIEELNKAFSKICNMKAFL